MLLYNPGSQGQSLSGPSGSAVPAQAKPSSAGAITPAEIPDLLSDATVSTILPAGGLEILNAKEPLAKDPTKDASLALAKALTPDVLTGVRAITIAKYVVGFAQMAYADRKKREIDILQATRKLRAWGVITRANIVAMCERDNEQTDTALKEFLATATALGIDGATILAFYTDVKALKTEEARLFDAQTKKEGGGSFKLYEWRPVGGNTTKISWYGPVSVRPRVAKLVENKASDTVQELKALFTKPVLGDSIPIDKVPLFPVPDIIYGVVDTGFNPWFSAGLVAGFADTLAYSAYASDGTTKSTGLYAGYGLGISSMLSNVFKNTFGTHSETPLYLLMFGTLNFASTGSGEYKPAKDIKEATKAYSDFVLEQVSRVFAVRDSAYKADIEKLAKKYNTSPVQYLLTILKGSWASFGDMIDLGLLRDPEWGGSGFDKKKTPDQVMAAALPLVRTYQDTYRNKAALKVEEGGKKLKPIGAYAKVLSKEGAIKSATTDLAIVPIVPVSWAKVGTNPVLYPHLIDVSAWKAYMLSPEVEAYQSITDSVQHWNTEIWGGVGPTVNTLLDDLAGCLSGSGKLSEWKPDESGNLPQNLPYPLVYPHDKIISKLPSYLTVASLKSQEVTGKQITPEQQDLLDVRSDYKSTVLLAMRSAEFAGKAMNSVEALIAAIKNLTKILYGDCPITDAPDDVPKEEYFDFYLAQTDACAKAPKDGSLLSILDKANVLYKSLLDKEAKGDKAASQTLQVVAEQIAKTQERVNVLVAELKGKLEQVKSGLSDDGGVFFFIENTVQVLTALAALPTTGFEPSAEEKAAIEKVKADIEFLKKKAYKAVGLVGAQAQTLTVVGESYSVDYGTSVTGGLTSVKNWALETLGTKKEGSLWWLILLAAAAAAKE